MQYRFRCSFCQAGLEANMQVFYKDGYWQDAGRYYIQTIIGLSQQPDYFVQSVYFGVQELLQLRPGIRLIRNHHHPAARPGGA